MGCPEALRGAGWLRRSACPVWQILHTSWGLQITLTCRAVSEVLADLLEEHFRK